MKIKSLPFSGESIFTRMSQLAKKYQAVNIGQGFPDFSPSPRLLEIYERKLRENIHQYAPSPGIMSLRVKISEMVKQLQHAHYDPETEITVTPGATHSIFSALSVLISPGDKVIIFEPCYDSYVPCIVMCGGTVCPVPLRGNDADWEIFDRLYSSDVKAVIINSPHNPSARVMSREFYLALADRLYKTDTAVISDEVYEHMVYDDAAHLSAASFRNLQERSFVISSFGKTFHVTGWKIGYVCAPRPLMQAFRTAYQFQMFSVNTVTQEVIAEMLMHEEEYLQLRHFYQKKRDYMLDGLRSMTKFDPETPQGTYFIKAKYNRISDLNDEVFCVDLLKKHNVALIPLSPFYSEPHHAKAVRFCFAKKEETIDRAISHLKSVQEL